MMIADYINGIIPADSEIREGCKPIEENKTKGAEKMAKTGKKEQKKEAKTTRKTNSKGNAKAAKKDEIDSEMAELLAQKRVLEERIARLERGEKSETASVDEETEVEVEIEGAEVKYFEDDEGRKRIAILFKEKPSDEVRQLLKKEWWRYHGKTHTWERNDKASSRESLQKIAEAM